MICKMSESKCAFVYIYITYTTFVTRVERINSDSQITLISEKYKHALYLRPADYWSMGPSIEDFISG